MRKNTKSYVWLVWLIWAIVIIFLCLFAVYLIRVFSSRQIDDVSPMIKCEKEWIDKSDILMVTPLFKNRSIAEYKTWCSWVLSLNKTLGMHGVYHTYNEFAEPRDEEYVRKGMEEFKKCFGFYPTLFQAPQLELSRGNERTIKKIGLKINGYLFNTFHKVYHCSDTGKFSNKFIDWI